MRRADSPLFKPVQIGNILLPNRFMRSATWEAASDDLGAPQPPLLSMIANLARGEVGLVVPGFVYPLRAGQAVPNQTGVYSAALCEAWRPTIAEIHRSTFSKIAFQICYAGKGAPGALTPSGVTPGTRAMSTAEVEDVVQSFITAAGRLKTAGADGAQLHGAHGFLISQFLSPAFNHRTDRYGQDRTTIVREIATEIRAATGPDFLLGIKINGDDYVPGGVTPELAGSYVRQLQPLLDFFEVSCGAAGKMHAGRAAIRPDVIRKKFKPEKAEEIIKMQTAGMEGITFFEGFNVEATRVIHRAALEAKLAVVGGIRKWAMMSQLVAEGTATLVSLSRPFIRQPNLVKLLKNEATDSDCITCGLCTVAEKPLRCVFPPKK
jgi:2,4-dienoyl-CoA reductase-like NADH-dependent reductase (Old Yellow Enzyme family)